MDVKAWIAKNRQSNTQSLDRAREHAERNTRRRFEDAMKNDLEKHAKPEPAVSAPVEAVAVPEVSANPADTVSVEPVEEVKKVKKG